MLSEFNLGKLLTFFVFTDKQPCGKYCKYVALIEIFSVSLYLTAVP